MVNFKTENSCAVVTGGGDGMGLQIALALVSNGCSVCICDISQQRLDAAAAQLHASVTKEHAGNIIISTNHTNKYCNFCIKNGRTMGM